VKVLMAGLTAWSITQSNPLTTAVRLVMLLQSAMRTETRLARLATPNWVPPTIPPSLVPAP
jgi:hypothetical protein